jgi:hypothetical protein
LRVELFGLRDVQGGQRHGPAQRVPRCLIPCSQEQQKATSVAPGKFDVVVTSYEMVIKVGWLALAR